VAEPLAYSVREFLQISQLYIPFSLQIFTVLTGGSAAETKALMHKVLSAKQVTVLSHGLKPSLPIKCYR